MADKIKLSDLIDYGKDIVLWQSPDKPHKILIYHTQIVDQVNGLQLNVSFRVLDSIGKIRYSGDHINLAINAYNKLYNE